MIWSLFALQAVAGTLPVHSAVLSDPRDGAEGERAALQVSEILAANGAYNAVSADAVLAHTGLTRADLFAKCGAQLPCWREVGRTAGIDQWVLVERVDAGRLGIRIADIEATNLEFRRSVLSIDGRLDSNAIEPLFFAAGTLFFDGAPERAWVVVDGDYRIPIPRDGQLAIRAGKHAIEIDAEGWRATTTTLLVVPGTRTTVVAALAPDTVAHKRVVWAPVVGVLLLGAAAGGIYWADLQPDPSVAP
jgi:hypothetical protein